MIDAFPDGIKLSAWQTITQGDVASVLCPYFYKDEMEEQVHTNVLLDRLEDSERKYWIRDLSMEQKELLWIKVKEG